MTVHNYTYPTYAKFVHLGMALFGIAAFLTGELAGDGVTSIGYLLHAYLGLSLGFVLLTRICIGFSTSQAMSFKGWSPFSRKQLGLALEDFRTLLKFGVPERDRHQGLAGLTQIVGLIIFTWMSVTGTALYFLAGPTETSIFEFIEELHEVGESLIPLYLFLHIGAVILHTISGNAIWRKMFSFKSTT